VGVDSTGASRFDVLLLSPGFLVPELPTVLNLWQQLVNPFNIVAAPEMDRDASGRDGLRRWHLLRGDVATKCGGIQAQLLGSVARRKSRHLLRCSR